MFLAFYWATVASALYETDKRSGAGAPNFTPVGYSISLNFFHSFCKTVRATATGRCGRDECAKIRCAASPVPRPRRPDLNICEEVCGLLIIKLLASSLSASSP